MQNTKRLSELLILPGKRLGSLKKRSEERSTLLVQIRAALPPKLAAIVTSAGLEGDRLTIGVTAAVWASRLRYSTEALRKQLGASSGLSVQKIRIRVVPHGT